MLNFLLFLGSVRESTPPRPARLGHRVALALTEQTRHAGHAVTLVDPLDYETPSRFKPHFAYAAGRAPAELDDLATDIEAADGFIMVSPEYNHSMSPALADLLNHFGSSLFSYKPSLIATYSAGQWGGTRAAVNMRTFLSELGCLPVSAMIHIPKAQELLDADGSYLEPGSVENWQGYFARGLSQLDWWATAAAANRASGAPRPEAFIRDPSERNAP